MTDNDDELMPLEDALRIIMKVPPKVTDAPTADGDDQVEPHEEDDQC
jgi:hypothetical protein